MDHDDAYAVLLPTNLLLKISCLGKCAGAFYVECPWRLIFVSDAYKRRDIVNARYIFEII